MIRYTISRAPALVSLLLTGLVVLPACDEDPDPWLDRDGLGQVDGQLAPDAGVRHDGAQPPHKDGAPPPPGDGAPPPPKDGAPPPPKDGTPPKPDISLHPVLYPTGRTQSPISAHVVKQLKQIHGAKTRNNRVLAKIGNSITVASSFLNCFAGSKVDLSGRTHLAPTVSHFKYNLPGGKTSWDRKSLCATGGWPAFKALNGSPSPLQQEISAISPRFAVVMFGSNDIGYKSITTYADNMLDITDYLVKEGVIPLLSSIPPRDDSSSANLEVPRYNAVVRGIAQARQVPFVDYHRELMPLSKHGLSSDGVHPTAYWVSGGGGACVMTSKGLTHGYNVRNLVTLEGLHRVKAVVLDGKQAPDPPGPKLQGSGAHASPMIITTLPFSDLRNTKTGGYKKINTYPGCSATQDESGPEFIYRYTVSAAHSVRAMVFDRGSVDIDVHLLGSSVSGSSCIKRGHNHITAQLQPGTYHFALDTFVKSGSATAGEYLFVLVKE